ncbi:MULTISPECIES: hypothetical protein [unclassified Leptotrichia]|uniref:hypothetical protein n=1 Tax=unclassified Leptotrichia TaxID=2633022 RepID=UPI0003ADDBF9|nr:MULTISPECIES: hypothetical protein [unclassified Leptotrichia]ERL27073.1 hypothetical protein HMPREF9108_00356 [Leptotrichia sp. oral taxon 225 str. F0581]WLD73349.1 hypothetical protein QU666_06850 [Leptotrichia sp. HMT-225]
MENKNHLKEIIDFDKSVKKTEKSLIFNDEFFKECGIVKYRFLFEEYDILYFKFGTCCKNWRGDIFFIEKLNFSDKYQHQWHSAFKFVLNDIDGYENMLTLSKYDKKIRLVFDTHTRAEFQDITIAYSFDELIDGLYLSDN